VQILMWVLIVQRFQLRNAHEITWASSCFDRLSTNGGGV